MNFELIKKHPYITGTVVIVGGFVLFLLLKGNNTAQAPAATGGGTSPQDAALQASYSLQSQGLQVQAQGQQLQADVANNQTAAQLQAIELQTAAAVQTSLATTQAQTQLGIAQVQASTDQAKISEEGTIGLATAQNQLWETAINAGVAENQSNNQAAVAVSQIQGDVISQQIQAQSAVAQGTLKLVQSGQLNKGGQGGQLQLAAVAAATGNNPAQVVAAGQPSLVSSSASSIIGATGKAGGSILSALFA